MRKRNALLVGVSLLWTTGAFAHEEARHTKLMGTVRSVDRGRMVVKTTDGKEKSIQIDDQTSCSEGERDLKCSSIKPGDRAVVTTRGKDGALVADEIRFSSGSKMESHKSSPPRGVKGRRHAAHTDEAE